MTDRDEINPTSSLAEGLDTPVPVPLGAGLLGTEGCCARAAAAAATDATAACVCSAYRDLPAGNLID